MKENNYEQLKKVYKGIQPDSYMAKHGWENLAARLPVQELPKRKRMPVFQYGILFAALLLCLTAGIVAGSQAAQPGTILYPVKTASEQVIQSFGASEQKEIITPDPAHNPSILKQAAPSPTPTVTPADEEKHKLRTEFEIIPTMQEKRNNTSSNSNSHSNNSQNSGRSSNEKREVKGANDEKQNGNKDNNGNRGNEGNENKNEKQEKRSNNSGKGN